MYAELMNLLPLARIRAFRRNYFFRLGVVALILSSLLVVLHGVFLLPTFLYAQGQVSAQQKTLTTLNATLGTTEERQVNDRLATLRSDVGYLSTLDGVPTASAPLKAVLAVPRKGIIVTGFTMTPASGKASSHMSVSGIAASRDALRNYDIALGQLPFVSAADLPISAYAKEQNIPFTIALSGSLLP